MKTNSHVTPKLPVSPAVRFPRIAVFGATRGIGRELLVQALEAGHQVTALTRDRTRIGLEHPRLSVVEGDATSDAAVRQTIAGSDAVLCALGAPALSASKVRSEGTRQIRAVMEELGVRRLIVVSLYGAGESRDALPFWLRYGLFPLYLRRAVAEHEAQEAILEGSDLDWTAVRPPFLTDGPRSAGYVHGFGNDAARTTLDISRADVADFMLKNLESDRYVRRAVGISYPKAA